MANIKSAQKRILVSNKKKIQNQMLTSKLKTALKKYNAAILAGDLEQAEKLLPVTVSIIDGVAQKGCIHQNNADRKKASVSKMLFDLKQQAEGQRAAELEATKAAEAEAAKQAAAEPAAEEAPKKKRAAKKAE